MKERCTGAAAGLWALFAFIKQLNKTVSYLQSPTWGTTMTIGDYK